VTFNGDGTGTIKLSSQGVRLPPQLNIFDPFATASASTGSFTYTVTDDALTSNNVPGTFKGMNTVGFGAGSARAQLEEQRVHEALRRPSGGAHGRVELVDERRRVIGRGPAAVGSLLPQGLRE
jgi:hypothetical protein